MEGFLSGAASVGQWSVYILWLLLLFGSCATILISLPGGWIALGLAVLFDLFHGFSAIGWPRLLIFAALLGLGEAIESVLGLVYVARKGATRYGMLGGFAGSILGAIVGSNIMPVIGTLIGGILGAFGGAVLGEYMRDQRLEPSMRIGLHATIGKLLATSVKFALSIAGAVVVAIAATPG